MKSLNLFSKAFSRFVFAVAIISTLAIMVSAQKVDPQSQGRMYGEPGFRGEPIEVEIRAGMRGSGKSGRMENWSLSKPDGKGGWFCPAPGRKG